MNRLIFTSLFFLLSSALLFCQESPAVYKIQQGFVDANGVMIYYEEFGEGEPLMILHGGPGASHDYFLPYLLPLARHNRLIFIDERGSGRSGILDDASQYTVENMVEDVEAVDCKFNLYREQPIEVSAIIQGGVAGYAVTNGYEVLSWETVGAGQYEGRYHWNADVYMFLQRL